MVSLLLGQGADINACDKNGWTALHFAAKAGYLNVVKLLTESGASPKFETKEGKVSICFAAAANHSDVLSFLMKRDHNTNHLMDDKKVGTLFDTSFEFLFFFKVHTITPHLIALTGVKRMDAETATYCNLLFLIHEGSLRRCWSLAIGVGIKRIITNIRRRVRNE